MSLIVAKVIDRDIFIVSDTRISFSNGTRSNYRNGSLKSVILSPEVTLCFAGDTTKGLENARETAKRLIEKFSFTEILEMLKESTKEKDRGVEFILAVCDPAPRILRIRDGEIEDNLQNAWIGEKNAFEHYQRNYSSISTQNRDIENTTIELSGPCTFSMPAFGSDDSGRPIEIGSFICTFTPDKDQPNRQEPALQKHPLPQTYAIESSMATAFQSVIDDPNLPSVGDLCIRLRSKDQKFKYLGEMFIFVEKDILLRDGDELINVMAQPVEDGGFAMCLVEPKDPGVAALGICFPRAKIAMIYLPLLFDEAQVLSNIQAFEFPQKVQSKFGISMSQPILGETGVSQ